MLLEHPRHDLGGPRVICVRLTTNGVTPSPSGNTHRILLPTAYSLAGRHGERELQSGGGIADRERVSELHCGGDGSDVMRHEITRRVVCLTIARAIESALLSGLGT